jgi:molybdate transport repressor ModE-like protein
MIGSGTVERMPGRERDRRGPSASLSLIHLQRVLDPLRLRLLLEIETRGSISAAAEACAIGQPSASMHLRTLEAATGHRLIERNGRGSRLTAPGQIVAAHAARVLSALDGLESELGEFRVGQRGTISIAASTVAAYLLPPALRTFGASHPGLDVDVRVGSSRWVIESIGRREAALGLSGDAVPSDRVRFETLLEDRVIGVAALGTVDPIVTAEQFARLTMLVSGEGSSTAAVVGHALSRAGVRPARTWTVGSNEAIKRSVREGLGVAFMATVTVIEELERGELSAFRVAGVPSNGLPILLAWEAGRDLTTAERGFAAALVHASARATELRPVCEAS